MLLTSVQGLKKRNGVNPSTCCTAHPDNGMPCQMNTVGEQQIRPRNAKNELSFRVSDIPVQYLWLFSCRLHAFRLSHKTWILNYRQPQLSLKNKGTWRTSSALGECIFGEAWWRISQSQLFYMYGLIRRSNFGVFWLKYPKPRAHSKTIWR